MEKLLTLRDGYIVIQGKCVGKDGDAIVILRSSSPGSQDIASLINDLTCNQTHQNDIYTDFEAFGSSSPYKMTIIHPATTAHIAKYSAQRFHMLAETSDMYDATTRQIIEEQPSSRHQWVYNILSHESESDMIMVEDSDPKDGFILLPDTKWAQPRMATSLYCLAICQDKSIRSVRDLNADHLSLLKNMRDKSLQHIETTYKINPSEIRVYVHYYPSYYHFHVHFAHTSQHFGLHVGKAILLETIIYNLSIQSDYYQRATLEVVIGEQQHKIMHQAFFS